MWEVRVPINVSTTIVVVIELFYAIFIYPPLTSYAAHLDARRWQGRFRLSEIRWYHSVVGGHPFGWYSTSVFVLSVIIACGFAFSLDSTDIPITNQGYADTVEMKTNFSERAQRDLTEATRICAQMLLNSTVVYRKPLMYKHVFREKGGREGNTRFDRVVGSWFTSCTGSRLGETLASDNSSSETVSVHTECCEKCVAQKSRMKLFVRVFAVAPDKSKISRIICSSQNTTLLRKAFSALRANISVAQPFLHLNNNIIPGYVWRFSGHKELREYVSRVDKGTQIGKSALLNVLLFIVLIPFVKDVIRWRRRKITTFHGVGEGDIAAWWSLAWWSRAQDGGVDLDDSNVHTFRIACAQLGWKQIEESMQDVGCNAFERNRLIISTVADNDEDGRQEGDDGSGDSTGIPTYKCPICGDRADKDALTPNIWEESLPHLSRLSLLENLVLQSSPCSPKSKLDSHYYNNNKRTWS